MLIYASYLHEHICILVYYQHIISLRNSLSYKAPLLVDNKKMFVHLVKVTSVTVLYNIILNE